MRIGFDAKRAFCNNRGLGNYSRTLLQGLKTFNPDNSYLLFTPAKKINELRNFQVITPQSFFAKKFSTVWRSLFLGKVLESYDLDIYHGLSHELPPFFDKDPSKKIVTIHDLIFLRFPEFFPWIDRIIYKRKFTHSCKIADKVIAICEQTKRDLIHFLNIPEKKIEICYQSINPIYSETLSEVSKQRVLNKYSLPEKYILFVGALDKRKNIINIIKAYSSLKEMNDTFLVVVGRGNQRKELEELTEQLHLKDKVLFFENVPTIDLPTIYQQAKMFVWPSFFEGFGLPIVEALTSGTPVITSKGSCFPEAGGPSSIYVDPKSENELSEAIALLLGDESLRKEMSKKGREYAQKFSLESTTKRLMEIYKETLF